jgi:predicted DNA-binding transcriptional regulator AlpA
MTSLTSPLPTRAQETTVLPNRAQRRAIRFKHVLDIVPLCPSRIYELINAGTFPAPFKIVEGGRASFFFEDEIFAYLEQRAAASRGVK